MSAPAITLWTDVDLVPDARELLARSHIVARIEPGRPPTGLENVDALIASAGLRCDAALFAHAARAQVLARVGIGYDRVDLAAATAAGVCAVNTPDAPTESTAEFTLALMLAVARKLPAGARPLADGTWTQGAAIIGCDLAGRMLGLVGCGRIGRRVAELAQAFSMRVQAYDPLAASLPARVQRTDSLVGLLASSDVISLHVPLSTTTRHLIGAAELAACKPGAILINTARGPLVDEAALAAALTGGRLAGAGLDVWDPEPPAADNPLPRLANVVATPHMAAATREGRRRSHIAATEQVLQVLRGERPPFLLNPEVWPRRRPGRP